MKKYFNENSNLLLKIIKILELICGIKISKYLKKKLKCLFYHY